MYRFIFTLTLSVFLFSANALPIDSSNELQSLTQKVDSLEHEFAYLKISYDIKILNIELSLINNEITTSAMRLSSFHSDRYFNKKIYKSSLEMYEAYDKRVLTLHEHCDKIKELTFLTILTKPFSEVQRDILFSSLKSIDTNYKVTEAALQYFKSTLDLYKQKL